MQEEAGKVTRVTSCILLRVTLHTTVALVAHCTEGGCEPCRPRDPAQVPFPVHRKGTKTAIARAVETQS